VEVYPRPDGTIYLCGIGGSDYIAKEALKDGAFLTDCEANAKRVQAAKEAFGAMSATYAATGVLDRTQACMRPCPPDALPFMGAVPGCDGAYINAGHNCWCVGADRIVHFPYVRYPWMDYLSFSFCVVYVCLGALRGRQLAAWPWPSSY
jgi:FAD dependent oxidoreductase